jgi:DNA-binding NarL/FixJ family response regulator
MYNIILIEDHPIFRFGLAEFINQQSELKVTAEAESSFQAIECFNKEKFDIAIIDISLKDSDGIELIKTLKINYPDTIILVLSMHDETFYAERALKAGAKGYIMKQEASTKITEAIYKILKGEIYISDKMKNKVIQNIYGINKNESTLIINKLSDRELQVFKLIGEGFGTNAISEKLNLSPKTIENYKDHIKQKLNINSAFELRKFAIQWSKRNDSN